MSLRQMQVSVDQYQDRLVLRISVGETDEYRAFITRRLLRDLWPILMSGLGNEAVVAEPVTKPQGDQPPPQDFSQSFDNPMATFPLGSKPLLVGEATLQAAPNHQYTLILKEPRERSFNLTLDRNLLHTLCAMLKAGADGAQWALNLEFIASQPTNKLSETVAMTHPPKALLH